MPPLSTVTLITNYIALVAAVWLGWYLITRNPRSLISWLTCLTLWCVGGLFLNVILALNPPPTPTNSPGWLRLLFPFWPDETFTNGWGGWLQGWQVTPAIVFWHHATLLVRPGGMNWWRLVRVIFGYFVALVAIVLQIFTPLIFEGKSGDPLYLNELNPGPLYIPFLVLLATFTIFSLVNLFRSAHSAPALISRMQLTILGVATITAGLTAPIAIIAAAFEIPIPAIAMTITLGISVLLIGYGITEFSALTESRTIRRDFLYNALAMGMITAIYSLVTWVSVVVFDVPPAAFVFVIILSIITHNLVDVTRHSLDTLFFQQNYRKIRANLRKLSNQFGEDDLTDRLNETLQAICNSVRATFGLILLNEDAGLKVVAKYNYIAGSLTLPPHLIIADDITHLSLNQLPEPLVKAALLVPLYVDREQIGAVIFGRPVNSIAYSDADLELIVYPIDQLAEVINFHRRERHYLEQLSELKETAPQQQISTKVVENALRNIFDYAMLGDSPLSQLELVRSKLSSEDITHLDRGKAVYEVLIDTMEKLRPYQEIPRDPPPREWHPYLILSGAYIDDRLNREIMSQLYISEGTFNRTRRAAVRSMARALGEMESKLH